MIQYQLSNGMWNDLAPDREYKFFQLAIQTETWLAPRHGREPMTTREQIIQYMEAGNIVTIGTDWYDKMRIPREEKPPEPVEMITCKCSHTIPRTSVMSTSRGTSCPDCYDQMSD